MKPLGVIHIDMLHTQVGVFAKDKDRVRFLRKKGVSGAVPHDGACYASAHMDTSDTGERFFSMVIKPEATNGTLAHECVHIADWIMDCYGIPTGAENTEVRGYLVGHLFHHAEEMRGKP